MKLPLLSSFFLPLALCSMACPQKTENTKPSPSTAKEKEPNNQASQAQKILQDLTLEAEISVTAQGRDEDWFWLPAVDGRWAYVEALPSPGVHVALEVMTPEGEVLLRTSRAGLGAAESIPNLGLSQPRFFRVVSAKEGSGGSYLLRVRFVDAIPGHEAEPNNRLSEAILVPLDMLQQGKLSTVDDLDWFRMEVPLPPAPTMPAATQAPYPSEEPEAAPEAVAEVTPRRLALEVEADAAAELQIRLCDDEGKTLAQTRPGHKGNWVVRNLSLPPNLASATLLLQSPPSNTAFVPTPYGFTLSLEKNDAFFEAEPNDTPSQATPLLPGRALEAFLSPATDVDYFRVDVAQASLVNVELSALPGVDLQLLAIVPANADTKEAERVLLRSNEGKIHEAERLLNVQCNLSCYFKVESVAQKISDKWTKTQENPKTPYKIRMHVSTDFQRREQEPNNTMGQATELSMGQNMRGHIYPKGDVDFFRLDFRQNLVRKPILATLFGLPRNSLGLWLHRLDNEGKLELVQTAPLPKKDSPTVLRYSAAPGVYFLEVKDSKNRESNFQDEYQLRVDDDLP